MKLNKLYFIFISFIILFSACSNEIEENNTLKNETTTLKIQVQSSARTVLPQTVAPEELTDFLLTGKINNNSFYYCSGWDSDETFEHYNHNFRRKYSSLSDLQNEKIKLIPADWEFTLTAKKGGTTYKAEKTQTIVQGENTISFNLILDDTGQEKGAFSLSLDFSEADNANKVTSASASLQNIDGTAVTGFTTQTLSVSSCKVTYSEDQLPVGSYRALITLYSDNLELLTWREIIVISSDLVSSAERKLDSLNLYRITYKLNDDENSRASFTTTALETYNRHSEIRTLPQISRDYYDFEGWHLKEDLSDESITELPESVNGNVTVYAKWNPITYSINYELNGGQWVELYAAPSSYDFETQCILPGNQNLQKTGYIFIGWYETSSLEGEDFKEIKKYSNGNKTYYAKWIPGSGTVYTVKHMLQDVDGNSYTEQIEDRQKKTGTTDSQTEAETNTYIGFTSKAFEQKSISADGNTEIVIFYDRITVTYTFNANGGRWSDGRTQKSVSGLYGARVPEIQTPLKTGYSLTAWNNTVPQYFDLENISFIANWKINEYKVLFNSCGGDDISDQTIIYGNTASEPIDTPQKEHYSFVGWYSDNTYQNLYNFTTPITEQITLFAKWQYRGELAKTGIEINGEILQKTEEIYVIPKEKKEIVIIGTDAEDNGHVFKSKRTVTLSNFIMGKYEVTQELYQIIMAGKSNPYPSFCQETGEYPLEAGEIQKYRPVEGITWYDAVYFCNALTDKINSYWSTPIMSRCYNIENIIFDDNKHITSATVTYNQESTGYRLPTEVEWEFAARGGDSSVDDWNYFFSGIDGDEGDGRYQTTYDTDLYTVAWYGIIDSNNQILGVSHEVGKKSPNSLGLYDMSGNVCEWCFDLYQSLIPTGEVTNPIGGTNGTNRINRGGSFFHSKRHCGNSSRNYSEQSEANKYTGFRIVRSCPKQ